MTTELMERPADSGWQPPILQRIKVLDTYAPNGVADTDQPRIEAIATISAGTRGPAQGNRPGFPTRSVDGTIYLHDETGRAPGLKAALARTNNKRLTIALPGNDLSRCIQQRFAAYSATKLLAYGDEEGIVELVGQGENVEHVFRAAGTPDFQRLLGICKVSVSLYFNLAMWSADGPVIVMPDGLGFYRLRFTSRNSLRSIVNYLEMNVAPLTGGRLAGLPLDLFISNREVAAPDGTRRKVPVFELRLVPPKTLEFNSRTFRNIAIQALNEASAMSLEPPRENVMLALNEARDLGPMDDDLDEAEVAAIVSRAATCDAEHWRAHWFATVKDTVLDSDDARQLFLAQTVGFDSLTKFLDQATDDDAQDLINRAQDYINEHSKGAEGAANLTESEAGEVLQSDGSFAPPVAAEREPTATADRVKVYNGLRNRATKMGIRTSKGEEFPVLSEKNKASAVESGIAKLTEKVAARTAEIAADKPAKPAAPATSFGDEVRNRMAPADPDADKVFAQDDAPAAEQASEAAPEAQEQPIAQTGGDTTPAAMRPISEAQLKRLNEIAAESGLDMSAEASGVGVAATNEYLQAHDFDAVERWAEIPKAAFEVVVEGLQDGTLTWGGDS